jgi:cysteine synthase A
MSALPSPGPVHLPDATGEDRTWVHACVRSLRLEADGQRDTPMREITLRGMPRVRLLLKDESVHPTGSLKHRLARSLFLYALCNGRLRRGQVAIDASSGSTAISEAWFARRLGIPFIAVMPRCTAIAKQREVLALGGRCELVEPGVDCAAHARALARELDACYLDQFGLAAAATDWRGNNNIAQSIIGQCRELGVVAPDWIVCGAGTGGTSGTIGRYLRYLGLPTRLCVADPTGAAFARGWPQADRNAVATQATCIEGIGRPRAEPCFAFEIVDRVIEVDDAASLAGMHWLQARSGLRFGGSSGTHAVAALRLACELGKAARPACIVALACDRGERYADTLYSPRWVAALGLDPTAWQQALTAADQRGAWMAPA